MKFITLLTVLLTTLSSFNTFANTESDIARVRIAMKSKVGISNNVGDVRLNVYKIDAPTCGSAGNSIIADFEVRKLEKTFDSNGNIALKSKWEVVKTYGVPLAEVEQVSDLELKSAIMDTEACLE